MSDVVRPLADVPRVATVMNEQQLAAVSLRGEVFVSAGAGTGKTSVLVERFVQAVCDEGLDVGSVLVVTYTNKAAAELRSRIRAELGERGRHDLARELDGAWVSTIHGFCARLLRAHPFAAGIDPRFRELDDEQGAVVRGEAFERALASFCASQEEPRLRLLATYGSIGLRRMLTGVYETLRSAGRPLLLELGELPDLAELQQELRAAAQALLADQRATPKNIAAAEGALALPSAPDQLTDLGSLRARGDRATDFEHARRRLQQGALEVLAIDDKDRLQELLELFAAEYAAGKARESAVDFEDLQLLARDLLRDREEIRELEQLRFRTIMVDEFQDTNALQCELIDLLAGGPPKDCFFVGDEFQSIYRFRHADVQVFRERRDAADQRLPLTVNYRSRPEVLAAVNYLFAPEFGESFKPLTAAAEFPEPLVGPAVELLVTDRAAYREVGESWRTAEARHIAARVRGLVDSGAAAPGEIVLLFAAGTDADTYEEELRMHGLRTYRATGRGYFGQQQVVDLIMYLRLLQNRYDDEALATVLASPFVGVSNDALVLVRRNAPRRPLYTGIERSLPPELDERDERLVRAFKQRYERLVAFSTSASLERMCEQILCEHDYELAVLARWDGARRYANLRKLMRMARSYEELRGRDVEGFIRFVRDQEALGAVQREAVSEEEGAAAVRLLTIHSAKGLEFKVVVVADAGRDTDRRRAADEILVRADGRFGFKVVHPVTGEKHPVFSYEAVLALEREAEEAERMRLYYVAMTRATDRLIVSGAVDPSRSTPIGWVLDRLECDEELAAAAGPFELRREHARFVVTVDSPAARAATVASPVRSGQLALFSDLAGPLQVVTAPGFRLPELAPVPRPPLHRVRRLSYSALALFDRCSYRYYAERVAGLRERRAGGGSGEAVLAATEIGDAVHRLLEVTDLADPRPPDIDVVRAWYPAVTDQELERISSFVSTYCGSPLARRIAGLAGARPERPFAFEHDGVLIHGRLDVLHRDGGRALVVDYKTNSIASRTPEEIVEADYRLQQLVYAVACFRAGADEVEVVYAFLERRDAVVSTTFARAGVADLEAELSGAIARIDAGDFVPTPGSFTCLGCPALGAVCAGPELLDGRLSDPASRP